MAMGCFSPLLGADPAGRYFSAEGGSAGTTANFASDLGLPEKKSFWYPIVTAHLGERHRFTFAYLSMRYTADTTVSRAINLQGQSFTVGAPLHSEATIKDLSVTYDYLAWKQEKWSAFVGGQVRYFDARVKLNSTGVNVNEKGALPLPTIGGGGEYTLRDWATLKGDYRVFAIPMGDIRGSLQDANTGVTVNLLDLVGREPRILCSSIFPSAGMSEGRALLLGRMVRLGGIQVLTDSGQGREHHLD